MKIKSIKKIGKKNVYDISVEDVEHYILEDGTVTHNTGSVYNSNVIWTISKAKEKDDKELLGFKFTINAYKSRFIKAESKIPIMVYFDEGIKKWSGMLDLAVEAGYVVRPTSQKYVRKDRPEETYKASEIEDNDEFWTALFKETDFNNWIKQTYKVTN